MNYWKLALGTLVLSGPLATSAASQQIGSAVVVVNQVTAKLRDTRTLAQGDGVNQMELIEVATDASSELKLNDETKMALGPGAKLMLDKFVYDGETAKGDIAVKLVKGAFRFVTGVASKPSYVVRVPQASITVRGTVFDVFVQDNGVSWLLLHEGAVKICNDRGRCRDLDEPGKLVRINDEGDVGPPSRWKSLKQKTNFDDAFPFVDKKPQNSPEVLTRDAILIDVNLPTKPPKDKVRDSSKDQADSDRPKTKKKRTEKAEKTEKPQKKKRVARGGDDDDGGDQAMQAIGLGLAIAGGIRIGGGGRGGGKMGGSRSGGMSTKPR